eukprot:GHVT01007126.1.p1 GENE.GHVT01007126.1~~GHVT01007126.1.p1  ORF type:complete len:399 (+),score=63.40 GHVT01007126.1:1142-2338(+)
MDGQDAAPHGGREFLQNAAHLARRGTAGSANFQSSPSECRKDSGRFHRTAVEVQSGCVVASKFSEPAAFCSSASASSSSSSSSGIERSRKRSGLYSDLRAANARASPDATGDHGNPVGLEPRRSRPPAHGESRSSRIRGHLRSSPSYLDFDKAARSTEGGRSAWGGTHPLEKHRPASSASRPHRPPPSEDVRGGRSRRDAEPLGVDGPPVRLGRSGSSEKRRRARPFDRDAHTVKRRSSRSPSRDRGRRPSRRSPPRVYPSKKSGHRPDGRRGDRGRSRSRSRSGRPAAVTGRDDLDSSSRRRPPRHRDRRSPSPGRGRRDPRRDDSVDSRDGGPAAGRPRNAAEVAVRHTRGTCIPCRFHFSRGCRQGDECSYCHADEHAEEAEEKRRVYLESLDRK